MRMDACMHTWRGTVGVGVGRVDFVGRYVYLMSATTTSHETLMLLARCSLVLCVLLFVVYLGGIFFRLPSD